MLVRDRMTANPVVGSPEMPVTAAQALMRQHSIRHLPIMDGERRLEGLITQRSLLRALPSDVSNFSRFEVSYVLGRIKTADVMTRDVITIDEDTAIEEAARVMADRKIGCLPVMRGEELVGIITDNDLFTIMVDLLGARRSGARLTVVQPDRSGAIARLTTAIAKRGGYLSVCVGYYPPQPDSWVSVLKVRDLSHDELVHTINDLGDVQILDLREMTESL